jgi:hypothetical protein
MQNESDALKKQADRSAPTKPGVSGPSNPEVNQTSVPERLKQLAADPDYPSPKIITSVAEKVLDLFRSE